MASCLPVLFLLEADWLVWVLGSTLRPRACYFVRMQSPRCAGPPCAALVLPGSAHLGPHVGHLPAAAQSLEQARRGLQAQQTQLRELILGLEERPLRVENDQ